MAAQPAWPQTGFANGASSSFIDGLLHALFSQIAGAMTLGAIGICAATSAGFVARRHHRFYFSHVLRSHLSLAFASTVPLGGDICGSCAHFIQPGDEHQISRCRFSPVQSVCWKIDWSCNIIHRQRLYGGKRLHILVRRCVTHNLGNASAQVGHRKGAHAVVRHCSDLVQ